MILKKLEIHNYRPFSVPTTIEFEPDVTILTGRNDVGKSAVLELIQTTLSRKKISVDDVNNDYISSEEIGAWEKDQNIKLVSTYEVTKNYKNYFSENMINGAIVDITSVLPVNQHSLTNVFHSNNHQQIGNRNVRRFPRVLYIPNNDNVILGAKINLDTQNDIERKLLRIAFGQKYEEKINSITQPLPFNRIIDRANRIINQKLSLYLPQEMGLTVRIDKDQTDDKTSFIFSIEDKHLGYTPITYRGAGIKKIIRLFTDLVTIDLRDNTHLVILLDEPENSLHADAQHLLRSVLEQLGKQPNIQVIYSTHSSSMINNIFPERIRLLTRTSRNGVATTQVVKNSSADNYYAVRVQLGMTPADSLLYAPVSVILEGKTETQNLGFIFSELGRERQKDFPRMGQIVSQIHFLDGEGDKFVKWIQMAQSQGSIPVVLLDGDKKQQVQNTREKYPDVKILTFAENKEFEDIVPRSNYFTALRTTLQDENITENDFGIWVKDKALPDNFVLTRKIEHWLSSVFKIEYYDKQATMQEALKLTSLDEIDTSKIEELIRLIEKKLVEYAT